jgi:hypothetical protein
MAANNFIRSPRGTNDKYVFDIKNVNRGLPTDWEVRISKNVDNGRPYYVNVITGKTQWDFPTTLQHPSTQTSQPSVRHVTPDEIIVRKLLGKIRLNDDERKNIINTYLVYKQIGETNLSAFAYSLEASSLNMDEKEDILVEFMSFDKSQSQTLPRQLLQSRQQSLPQTLPQLLPQPLPQKTTPRFPKSNEPVSRAPGFIPTGDKRIEQFFSLTDKVQKQLVQIEKWASLWKPAIMYLPVLLQIFDEFYTLVQLNRKERDLEALQVECLRQIIGNTTSLSYTEKKNFMMLFASTLNDDTIYKYCRNDVAKNMY